MVAPYDKKRHPTLGNVPANLPDEAPAWTICITNTPTQYLYTSDDNPGRIYKMGLDGTMLTYLWQSQAMRSVSSIGRMESRALLKIRCMSRI